MQTKQIERIETDGAPRPGGHYSQAMAWGDLIYISGQLPINVDGTHTSGEPFEAQAVLALRNLLAIAEAAGSSSDGFLKVTAYMVGIENWPVYNAVHARFFGDAKPARAVVPVGELNHNYLIEVEGVAVRLTEPHA